MKHALIYSTFKKSYPSLYVVNNYSQITEGNYTHALVKMLKAILGVHKKVKNVCNSIWM